MAAEIQELNLTYLMLAQRLLHADRNMGMLQLQLDKDMADLLLSLTSAQLARLANINQLLFRLCFNESSQLRKLTQNERLADMSQTHAALLLSAAATARQAKAAPTERHS